MSEDRRDEDVTVATASKYAHLPPRVRREDLRTSHDVVPHPEVLPEAERERDWLLRTTGLFV